jgi:hypothetical protein
VLYDVLLHLPAKTLCRLRAVSRSWRSLLTADPHFAEAHASHHPLVVTAFFDEDRRSHADIFDLSGNRLRRVTLEEPAFLITGLCTHGNLACLTQTGVGPNRVCLINLATGVASVLPGPEEAGDAMYMLGEVASSGEHKLLCVDVIHCHVFVLGLGGNHRRWRRKKSPPVRVAGESYRAGNAAVVQGTVYCLVSQHTGDAAIYKDSMVSFDLETEEWAPTVLPGPLGDGLNGLRRPCFYLDISLAELSGYLVTAHTDHYTWSMDLWFRVEGQWCRRYHIWLNAIFYSPDMCAEPWFVFDDGRIVLSTYDVYKRRMGFWVYDTRSKARIGEMTEIRDWDRVGVCTGSLLCP